MSTESEVTSLKRIKRDMDAKIVELEDELDEASLKYVRTHTVQTDKCEFVCL